MFGEYCSSELVGLDGSYSDLPSPLCTTSSSDSSEDSDPIQQKARYAPPERGTFVSNKSSLPSSRISGFSAIHARECYLSVPGPADLELKLPLAALLSFHTSEPLRTPLLTDNQWRKKATERSALRAQQKKRVSNSEYDCGQQGKTSDTPKLALDYAHDCPKNSSELGLGERRMVSPTNCS